MVRSVAAVVAILFVSTWCLGQVPSTAGPAAGVLTEETSLPKYLTAEEALLPPLPVEQGFRAPPTGTVYCPAEYEQNAGLFIAWEGYTDILTAMTVGITTQDPTGIVYVVVDSTSEQTSAYSSLSGAGADMSQVQFIVRTTDTVWIRDYGPRFIFVDAVRSVVDHTYNRPRPNDNAFNDHLCSLWSVPQYDIPLTHGGGNFHCFSNGDAFMSTLIQTENPGLTAQQIKDLYEDYQGVNLTIYPGFPTSFDSTQHIDMWMLAAGDDDDGVGGKVIIGQYASSTGQPYTITENAVTDLIGRGYTVYRTPGWNSGGTHYTYTNATIFNNLVFVPKFNVSPQDGQALAVFQQAFPGKTLIQVDCSGIIGAAGAMHCIVMHMPAFAPDPLPHVRVDAPNGAEKWYVGTTHNIYWTASDDEGVTGIDILYSTDGGATYPHVIATGEVDDSVFEWIVPDAPSTTCRVKVIAYDDDSNSAEDVSDADFTIAAMPAVVYSFPMDTDPGWSATPQWEFGVPAGGGTHNKDPLSGYTGSNVYGYNLAGDYGSGINPTRYLTTNALNCTGLTATELRFWRWLGVEKAAFDHASIQVSNNGSAWTTIWENPSSVDLGDTAWTQMILDISAYADDQPAVYVRWGMGTTDGSITFPGWNIDDVEIWALGGAPDGACCQADGSCEVATEAECTGTWQGADTVCDPNPCPQPQGACCYADGSCSVTEQAACTGTWQGAATACDPNPCPQPQGACCYTDGSCSVTEQAACTGTWQGAGTVCDPNPCPQPWCLGDMNCSGGAPTFDDIKYFAVAMSGEAAWQQYYRDQNGGVDPPCPWLVGDYTTPHDGVEFSDIKPFAAGLGGACQTYVP